MIEKVSSGETPTISIEGSNRRAKVDAALLFNCLEDFANLPDDSQAFAVFFNEYTEFMPVRFHVAQTATNQPLEVGWQSEFYLIFREFRDMLRRIWEQGSNSDLGILLGTDTGAWEILNRHPREPGTLDRIISGPETRLQSAMAHIPMSYFAAGSTVFPDWRAGAFRYDPNTMFRRAVYQLFRQSWRAKICPECRRYFIAEKPPQFYCSPHCYGAAKRVRDLEFWRSKGSDRRKKRRGKEKKK